jgi:hypothetical protein
MRLARESWWPLAPVLVLTGAALFLARDPGNGSLPWLGLGALVLLLVLFATRGAPKGLVALIPLGLLGLWCAASIAWSVEPDRSWTYANRTFVYLAFALLGAFLGAEPRRLLYGMSILLGAVCVWSLLGKVLPWLYEDYGRIARLRGPIGYWNALALLGDIALPIGLCLATRMRAAGTLLVFGWLVVIGLTYSRGGILVAVVVVALWMYLSKAWLETLSTLLAAGLPALAALAVAFSLSGLTSDGQSHVNRARDGAVFAFVVGVDAGIAVLLSRYKLPGTLFVRRLALGAIALAVVAVIAFGAVHARSAWHSFTTGTGTEISNSPGRIVASGSNFRSQWWKQAWWGFKTDPLKGTGAGSFEVTNLRYRTSSLDQTIEPHNVPLQFLSETGVIGFLLLLASIAWLVTAGRRRPGPQLALALALPAYFLHSILDFDWDFASVSIPVFLIAGALVVKPSDGSRPRSIAVATAIGVASLLFVSLIAVWLGNRWDAQAAAAVGVDNQRAITLAKRARSINPYLVDPLYQAALAESAIAHGLKNTAAKKRAYAAALGYYTKATEVQPHDAMAWYDLGWFDLYVRNCPHAAYPAVNRFTTLDGQDPKNAIYAITLKKVNSGKYKC